MASGLISTVVLEAVDLDLTLRFSSVTLCISQQWNPILLLITNCGLTTHQIIRHGEWLTSTPVQTVVILDNTWNFFLVGDTLYFSADDGSIGHELWAHRPSSISYNTNTGGNVTTWAINASLPSGVSFGTNNGTIYGTPTELWTQTSYMVWANNSGGSSVAYLNITVVEELANIAYNPTSVTVVRGYTMANISANNTGGAVVSWAISPTLPSGLSFDNGTIYGRPLSNMSATTYTVYANNSGGSATATLTLTVNEPTPNVDYSPDNYTLTNGTSYTITPTLLGQTGNISSILGAGTPSAHGACTYGNLLIFRTDDWRMLGVQHKPVSLDQQPVRACYERFIHFMHASHCSQRHDVFPSINQQHRCRTLEDRRNRRWDKHGQGHCLRNLFVKPKQLLCLQR